MPYNPEISVRGLLVRGLILINGDTAYKTDLNRRAFTVFKLSTKAIENSEWSMIKAINGVLFKTYPYYESFTRYMPYI